MNKIKSNPSKTVLTIMVGFGFVYFFTLKNWALYLFLSIGLIGVFSNLLSSLIEKVWFKIASILSLIVPNILLTIIFFIVLLPISILSKLLRKEKDTLHLSKKKKTNYKQNHRVFKNKNLINPW